ncbi:ABC transporter permease [Chondrinema litorale]|uniref:ABC transporter permease n=1 Tax=Chondrinema litorale TaxID=2994555 RepID=UPI0032B3FC91
MKKEDNKYRLNWLLLMAWRDSRKSRGKLMLFISSITLGIAALVAINSFRDNLLAEIDNQAKSLIGADIAVYNRSEISDTAFTYFDTMSVAAAKETRFASMCYFPKNEGTRLVQIKALEGDFPFYGNFETEPIEAADNFRSGKNALVDNTLLIQYNAQPGDSIKIGNINFLIQGRLLKAPGQIGLSSTIAPTVYIPAQYLDATGLIKKGSRINYSFYYKLRDGLNADQVIEDAKPLLKQESLRADSVNERKEQVGETFSDLTKFLNLVGFVALLLGSVGVASAVHIYVKEKLASVAVFRCLGMSGIQAFLIFLFQVGFMGIIGAVVGTVLGASVQILLPEIMKDFLPVEVSYSVSYFAILQGVTTGILVSIIFAIIPLLGIRKTSPLRVLREDTQSDDQGTDPYKIAAYAAIVLFIFFFSWIQVKNLMEALMFMGLLTVLFLVLTGVAYFVMWLVKKYFPVSWGYIWRQGIANLYRPHNQTLILIITIGLGTALIATLFFIQGILLDKVSLSASENQPNLVLFDIQTPQKEEIHKLVKSFDLPLIQKVPIVNMRVSEMNGMNRYQNQQDTTSETPEWVFNREYRVTYRDTLIDSESVTEGVWHGEKAASDTIFISLDEGFARRMGVKIGDELVFNVQGTPMKTVVSSLRDIDWNRVQTNFLVVFPSGILEEAPQFHVVITRVKSDEQSAELQQALVQKYPNVSAIDLGLILKTLDDVLDKASFVIRFMALFSIVTGLVVLIGSLIISKYQRIHESVLLRTLGAKKQQILKINAIEYAILGTLASVSGILLALLSSWIIAFFNFETTFYPDLKYVFLLIIAISLATLSLGLLNYRGILNKSPLEILRSES